VDHNNDKRKLQTREDNNLIKSIKHNYNILKKILSAKFYENTKEISLSLLKYENYNFSAFHKKEKLINGNEVLVIYDLGLTCINVKEGIFSIINIKNS
jgi:hypothetical protein